MSSPASVSSEGLARAGGSTLKVAHLHDSGHGPLHKTPQVLLALKGKWSKKATQESPSLYPQNHTLSLPACSVIVQASLWSGELLRV